MYIFKYIYKVEVWSCLGLLWAKSALKNIFTSTWRRPESLSRLYHSRKPASCRPGVGVAYFSSLLPSWPWQRPKARWLSQQWCQSEQPLTPPNNARSAHSGPAAPHGGPGSNIQQETHRNELVLDTHVTFMAWWTMCDTVQEKTKWFKSFLHFFSLFKYPSPASLKELLFRRLHVT